MTIREVDIRPTSEPAPKVGATRKRDHPQNQCCLKKTAFPGFSAREKLCAGVRLSARGGPTPLGQPPALACGLAEPSSDFPRRFAGQGEEVAVDLIFLIQHALASAPRGSRPLGDGDNAGSARGKGRFGDVPVCALSVRSPAFQITGPLRD
jgi:hypothetical protein